MTGGVEVVGVGIYGSITLVLLCFCHVRGGDGIVSAGRYRRGLGSGNMHPATTQVLVLRGLSRRACPVSLLRLRTRLRALSGSAVSHSLTVLLRRRTVRTFRSKDKSVGCRVYQDSARAYFVRGERVRFCYRIYRGACYVSRVGVPIIRLPRNFVVSAVGCAIGKVYPTYGSPGLWGTVRLRGCLQFFTSRWWGRVRS